MTIKGIGGVFIKAQNPEKLYEWYESKLGLLRGDQEATFVVPTERLLPNFVKVSFEQSPTLISLQVDKLAPLLGMLSAQGVPVEDRVIENNFGAFAWIHDPEGNRIELWEPRPYQESLINLPEAE